MPLFEPIIGLPDYKLVSTREQRGVEYFVEFIGQRRCPRCQAESLRKKDSFIRRLRHHSRGIDRTFLVLKCHKFLCRKCGKYFNDRLPGVLPRHQSTEPFRHELALKHHQGIARSVVAKNLSVSPSTVERSYKSFLKLKESHRKSAYCPRVLGIDEKHFTKKKGYLTTFCDLRRRKVFDVTLGRSELSLQPYLNKLEGKSNCRVVVMDLSETYRSIVKKHLESAMIVADRFHVVKLINHHFLKTWADLDEVGRKNRGLLSLMRRHPENLKPEQVPKLQMYLDKNPAMREIYLFKQHLMKVIKARVSSKPQARELIPVFLDAVRALKDSGFKHMKTLGDTLENWQEEIVRMWRFSKTNSITEGLHNRMEEIIRRAYGFRNFENFRLRVKEYCS